MKKVLISISVLSVAAVVFGDQATPPKMSPYEGFSFNGGLDMFYHPSSTTTWYKITYKGNQLLAAGAAPAALDASGAFSLGDKSGSTATVPGFQLDIFQGTGGLAGTAFEGSNLQSFAIPRINLGPAFMVQSDIAGSMDGKSLNGQVGIEHFPFNLRDLGLKNTELANWLIPGVAAAEAWTNGQPSTPGVGIATLRGFLGKAWGYVHTKTMQPQFAQEDYLAKYPTFKALGDAMSDLISGKRNAPPMDAFALTVGGAHQVHPGDSGFTDDERAHPETVSAERYKKVVNEEYTLLLDKYLKVPSYTLGVETKNWYTFAGEPNGPRWKPMVAAVFTLWNDYGTKARSSLEFRYENGFAWSDPKTRQNRFMITAGLNF